MTEVTLNEIRRGRPTTKSGQGKRRFVVVGGRVSQVAKQLREAVGGGGRGWDPVGGAGEEGEPVGGGSADDDAVDGVLELAEERVGGVGGGIEIGGGGGGLVGLGAVREEAGGERERSGAVQEG